MDTKWRSICHQAGLVKKLLVVCLSLLRGVYLKTLDEYRNTGLKEGKILEDSIVYLNNLVERSVLVLGNAISPEGIIGLQRFVSINYRDLIREITSGKKQEGEALQTEIWNIEEYLRKFKL